MTPSDEMTAEIREAIEANCFPGESGVLLQIFERARILARREENEACAKVADARLNSSTHGPYDDGYDQAAYDIAAAIRARVK